MFRDDLPSIANYKTSFRRKQPKDTCVHTKKHWRNGNIPQNIILLECPLVSARTVRRLLRVVVCLNHYSISKKCYLMTCISLYNKRRSLYIIAQYLYKWAKSSMLLYIYISTAVRFFFTGLFCFPHFPVFQGFLSITTSLHPPYNI